MTQRMGFNLNEHAAILNYALHIYDPFLSEPGLAGRSWGESLRDVESLLPEQR